MFFSLSGEAIATGLSMMLRSHDVGLGCRGKAVYRPSVLVLLDAASAQRRLLQEMILETSGLA